MHTEKRILSDKDMEILKKEYHNLNNLLIPKSKVKFMTILGEGTYNKIGLECI